MLQRMIDYMRTCSYNALMNELDPVFDCGRRLLFGAVRADAAEDHARGLPRGGSRVGDRRGNRRDADQRLAPPGPHAPAWRGDAAQAKATLVYYRVADETMVELCRSVCTRIAGARSTSASRCRRQFLRSCRPPGNAPPEARRAPRAATGGSVLRRPPDRRGFLRTLTLAGGALGAASLGSRVRAQAGEPAILELPAHSKGLGQPVARARLRRALGARERTCSAARAPGSRACPRPRSSFTPLQGMFGIITPSGLHFERHHQGWHDIDPAQHRLMIKGLVSSAARLHDGRPDAPAVGVAHPFHRVRRQHRHGVGQRRGADRAVHARHALVLRVHRRAAVAAARRLRLRHSKRASYVLAEGADGSSMTRTIAIERALDDVIVACGMNGEMLRPENGYPLRLVVPGVQGVSWVKWLRRIEVGDQPWDTKDETLHYVDLMPDGVHRQYTSIQECKSVITTPSGGQMLRRPGFYNVTGLAWSGRGRSSASTSRSTAAATGGPRGSRSRCCRRPDALQYRLDLGRRARRSCRPARSTTPATCSRRSRSCARCAARDRSITTTRSSRGTWPASGEVGNVQVGLARSLAGAAAAAGRRWRSVAPSASAGDRPRRRRPPRSRAWDIDVRADFKGLPRGLGHRSRKGEDIWEAKCASCHGIFGESNEVFTPIIGGTTPEDVEDRPRHGADRSGDAAHDADEALALSTLWDYIHRAMPWNAPKSLSDRRGLRGDRVHPESGRSRARRTSCCRDGNIARGAEARCRTATA